MAVDSHHVDEVVVDPAKPEAKAKTRLVVNLSRKAIGKVALWVELQQRQERKELLTPTAKTTAIDVNLEPPHPSAPFATLAMIGDPAFQAEFQARVTSTTLTLTWVAMGRRAAYVSDGDLRENMHFAAGVAICRAAGCVVTDLNGDPLPPDGHGWGLLAAADARIHAALLAVVRRLAGDRLAT